LDTAQSTVRKQSQKVEVEIKQYATCGCGWKFEGTGWIKAMQIHAETFGHSCEGHVYLRRKHGT
jgi:hypothetical protein